MVGKMKILIYLEDAEDTKEFIAIYEDIEHIPISHVPRIGEKVLIGARHSIYKVIDVINDIEVDEIKVVVRELNVSELKRWEK